jgi:protein TonB
MTPRTTRFEPQLAIADALSESSLIPSPIELSAKYREAIVAHAAPTRPGEIISSAGGSGSTGAGAGGSGLGSAGSGSGIGSGRGSSPSGAITTQARYSDTPKPVYPENARREGREGRVLLRVMIDEQGKTKTAAVNRSSGSDALDQAALDAIKRWRFHPARADDKPVESWVNIPIDFRLTDAKN